mgnify:CR=1 FL=1
MFIGFEYAGIIFSSVTGGLILGKILAECAKTVLQNIFYNTITTEVNYGFIALRNTLVISCEVFGILFIVLMIDSMSGNGCIVDCWKKRTGNH